MGNFAKTDTKKIIIDTLIVLLHITYGMSMLKVWLLDILPIPNYLDLAIITTIAFFLRFGGEFKLLTIKNNGFILLFFALYFADILQGFQFGFKASLFRFFMLVDIYLFMEYIYAIYIEKRKKTANPISGITVHFELFSAYNIAAIALCALLIFFHVISPYSNPLPLNSLISNNDLVGANYYFPGHLSLTSGSMRGLVSSNIPVLTGLTHEPHVLFYLIGPCFFFLLFRVKNSMWKVLLLYFLYFSILIISTSVTALISFIIVIVVEQLYNIVIGKGKTKNIIILIIVLSLLSWFMSIGKEIVDDVTLLMTNRISAGNDEGSKGFSFSMLMYIFSPSSLFGSGNMPGATGFELDNINIGYLSCVLDVIFIIIFVVKMFKNIISFDRSIHYCGLATLYFFLHTQKMGVQTFNFQYLSYYVILLLILDKEREQKHEFSIIQ